MTAIIAALIANKAIILGVLLGISEALSLIPRVGAPDGILAALIKVLKAIMGSTPPKS